MSSLRSRVQGIKASESRTDDDDVEICCSSVSFRSYSYGPTPFAESATSLAAVDVEDVAGDE